MPRTTPFILLVCLGATAIAIAQTDDQDSRLDQQQVREQVSGRSLRAQPGVRTPPGQGAQGNEAAQPGEQMVTISQVSEPVELRTLVDLAIQWLGIQVAIDPGLSGSVVFTQPVSVPRDELLDLIGSLLEMQGYAIVYDDRTGFYNVVSASNVPVNPGGTMATTRIIETPNVRPSALKTVIDQQVGTTTARITYMDELGLIVMTGTSGQLGVIERLVDRILEERSGLVRTRIELEHVSAPVAKVRLLELVGQAETGSSPAGLQGLQGRNVIDRNNQPTGQPSDVTTTQLENLSSRLFVAQSGNALLFLGRENELDEIMSLVDLIDVVAGLEEHRYFTGTQTEAIAEYASRQGLGEVVMMGMEQQAQQQQGPLGLQDVQNFGAEVQGGSRIVADVYAQHIVYYGTAAQQEQMAEIVSRFEPEQDLIVVKPYKLYHADALETSDLINALLTNQVQAAEAPLLPGGGGSGAAGRGDVEPIPMQQPGVVVDEGAGFGFQGGQNVFVVADEGNNQLLVKAPQKQQIEFERLIRRIDLRRPQVFLDVQIVAVTWTDNLQLGVELQGINSNGTGGAFNTNFGLSSFSDTAGFVDPKSVATGLAGLTAAIVNTDEVPIIINAVQNTLDGRIISAPKLLVDDNVEATIQSVEQQPIQNVSQGQVSDQVVFGGFEDAGTTLTVTPTISEGGNVKLAYEITLSDFVGQGSDGLPPPRLERTVSSEAVTVPSDMTVVVGGIEVDDTARSKLRVPLIGDIPLVGLLFGKRTKDIVKTNLYVFITPRVLRDPTPIDYRLLTRGPQEVTKLPDPIPRLEPVVIPIVVPAGLSDEGSS